MVKMKKYGSLWIMVAALVSSCAIAVADPQGGFPYKFPDEKPDRPLSAAMERNYTAYPAPRPENNELYTQFKYARLKGFDYNGHDGTISRRDPSKVIFANGKYYVWYTKRHTPTPPQGAKGCTDTIPSADWDLSDIWYATSKDGFTWKEQGVAVPRPPKPNVGWRSVTTTDILVWEGKYYLYYQGFMEASGTRGDDCPVAVSWADSPEGPWTPYNKIVIPNGAEGDWDQYSIHDPYPLVHDGKIFLYYKSDSNGKPNIRMHGLAIADSPLGPFKKHPLNPVLNSGHETTLFPFKGGVAALIIRDGNEHSTVQYAEDWVNFEIKSIVELMPNAGGPFIPDAFTNTGDGRGITWGISHFTNATGNWKQNHAILARFDCDLSLDVHDTMMKKHSVYHSVEVYFKQGLNTAQRRRIDETNRMVLENSKPKSVENKLTPKQANNYVWIYKPAGDYFFGPDTERLKEGRWYDDWVPNDHAFVKGNDGKWHIFGITHPNVKTQPIHEGEFASFHAVSTAASFKEAFRQHHYTDLPKVLPPKERPNEPIANHAPYIVKKDGLFHMVYGPSPIRLAVSSDLSKWDLRGNLFSESDGARDPNLLFHDGTYYIVYCSFKSVRLRESKDLIHWSEPKTIFKAKRFDPESPSLIYHNNTFYLFVCSWDGNWDGKDVQGAYQYKSYVLRSDNPLNFGTDDEKQITTLNSHAPEIFQDEDGQWYISSVEWPNRGVSVDKLSWVDKP